MGVSQMKDEEFNDYIETRYKKQIEWYDNEAIKNQKLYKIFQWITLVLAAFTPILIILGEGWVKWLAVAVAVLVAISIAALKTFKYQENWINYRTTCETLRKEHHYYKAGTQAYESVEDKKALFVDRVEALISREHTLWLTTHQEKKQKERD